MDPESLISHVACGLGAAVAAPSAKPQKLPY